MPNRNKSLKRLVHLYSAVEAARSGEMQRAQLQLLEAERAIAGQQAESRRARVAGRHALGQGDRIEWMLAESQAALARMKRGRIEPIAAERGVTRDVARERYLASRIESEQMSQLLDDAARRAALVQTRKAQALADDRFLSRKRWSEMKKEMLAKKAGKVSML